VSILGTRVNRIEDPRLLTEGGLYVDDIALEGAVWATFVRSTIAHAQLTSVDTEAAAAMPGVVAVASAADVDLPGPVPLDNAILPDTMPRPFLAGDVVRYVGEPIAVVLTETRAQGADAIEPIAVDYDPLPAVIDPEDAAAGEVVLHPAADGNVCFDIPGEPVDLEGCDVVVRQRLINQRVVAAPLEVQASACRWTDDGRLELWTGSQGPHVVRTSLASIYGLDEAQVRVVSPDVGGGFGSKSFPSPETLLLPWLARWLGRPVRWTETRSESMLSLGHGRAQVHDIVIGGTRDGTVLAYDLTVLQDAGAYPRLGALLPLLTRMMHPGTYRIPRTSCRVRSVVTNTAPVVAYRGAGRPEAAAAIERAIDLFAVEAGLDPAEVRRRNFVPPDAFPYSTTGGTVYDSGQYERALDLVLEAAGYAGLRDEQARRRERGDHVQLGIGLSAYVEVTALTGGPELGRVEVLPDGKARVLSGTFPQGQGHVTSWVMLVAERTGIPPSDIEVIYGDTDAVPAGGLTGGSRSAQIGGVNVWRATGQVIEAARHVAGRLLEAHPDDIVLDASSGQFHVAGTPARAHTWAEVAAAAAEAGEDLTGEGDFEAPPQGSFPSGAHLAVVEVDVETGLARLVRVVAVDDAGRILNPVVAEGQVHGGVAQGAAQALLEEFSYDPDGNPVTTNLADYTFVSAAELPDIETVHLETASPNNELGVKGIGESGSIGATPAVQNAVVDALAHLGVRHVQLPATPERVWQAIAEASTS
jgi:aerobic carbon-monoxide dehydrogenase large subunit